MLSYIGFLSIPTISLSISKSEHHACKLEAWEIGARVDGVLTCRVHARLRRLIGASMLVISYGYQIREHGQDPFIEIVKTAAEDFAQAALTGAFLVDIIPACALYDIHGAW